MQKHTTYYMVAVLGLVRCVRSYDIPEAANMVTSILKEFQLDFIFLNQLDTPFNKLVKIQQALKQNNLVAMQSSLGFQSHNSWKKFPVLSLKLEPQVDRLALELPLNQLDFYLLEFNNMTEAKSLLDQINLRLDSNVYFYLEETPTNNFTIYEAYKIYEQGELIINHFASYDSNEHLTLASNASKYERRGNLRGFDFKIAALSSRPYMQLEVDNVTGTVSITGMYATVLFELQSILNFTYTFVQPEDGAWGNLDETGESWTGMIGQLMRHEIDFSPTSFTITEMRSRVVDFAHPIVEMHHRFFIKNPDQGFNWTVYADPLKWQVWVVMAILILLATLVLWTTVFGHRITEEVDKNFFFYRTLSFATGALTFAKPWSAVPSQLVAKWVFALVIVSGSLIYWHWEAMLISFLSVRTQALPFRNIEGLVAKTQFRIALVPGTSFEDSFRHSNETYWQQAWIQRIEPHISEYPSDKGELIQMVLDDPTLTLYDNYFSIKTFDPYKTCDLIDIPQPYEPKTFAYAFQKNSPYVELFDFYIDQMREGGRIDQITARYVRDDPPTCSESSGEALGFENCFTAFLALIGGVGLSLILFVCELLDVDKSYLGYFHDNDHQVSNSNLMTLLKQKNETIEHLKLEIKKLKRPSSCVKRSKLHFLSTG